MTSGYYDRDGKPMTFHEWGRRIGDVNYCMVAVSMIAPQFLSLDALPNNESGVCVVSTVWLGLDSGYGNSEFTIFQSKCVGGTDTTNGMIWSYATREDAEKGHEAMVSLVLDSIGMRLEAADTREVATSGIR